jgi:uncharacterized protein YecE (DUF72 family)
MATRVPLIQVGTSGWHYPQGRGAWTRIVYPPPKARGGVDELTWYADRFHTVEVNASFYRDLSQDLTAKWVARTPPGFEFAIKLHQQFTHPRMHAPSTRDLAPVPEPSATALAASLDTLAPLHDAGRLGPLLAQFPPSFKATPEAMAYLSWLADEVEAALAGTPLAVELRHRSWSDARPETLALLDAAGAAWVLIDEPKFRSSVWQKPDLFVEELRDRPWAYVRLHGRNAAQWWDHAATEDRYNYLYTPEELEPFVDVAEAAAALGKKLYLYAKNHFAGNAVANAAQVRARLGKPVEAPFPRTFLERFPQLEGVVKTDALF